MVPGIGVRDLGVPTDLPSAGGQRAGTLPASTINTSVNGSEMNGGGQASSAKTQPSQKQQSRSQGGNALYPRPASAPEGRSSVSSTSGSATHLPSDMRDIDDEAIDLGGPSVSILAGSLSSGVARYAGEEYDPLLKGMGSWVNEKSASY